MPSFVASRPFGRRLLLGAPLALAAPYAHAQGQEPEVKFERSSLVVVAGGRDIKFDVDLALNDTQRSRGLMYRKQLGAYEGMLFDFYQEMPVSFWMKNTLIPLSAAFVADDGRIVNIEDMKPQTTDNHCSAEPVRYVLEMNQGWFAKKNIKKGFKLGGPLFEARR